MVHTKKGPWSNGRFSLFRGIDPDVVQHQTLTSSQKQSFFNFMLIFGLVFLVLVFFVLVFNMLVLINVMPLG